MATTTTTNTAIDTTTGVWSDFNQFWSQRMDALELEELDTFNLQTIKKGAQKRLSLAQDMGAPEYIKARMEAIIELASSMIDDIEDKLQAIEHETFFHESMNYLECRSCTPLASLRSYEVAHVANLREFAAARYQRMLVEGAPEHLRERIAKVFNIADRILS